MSKDMSQKQFNAKCREYGFVPLPYLGYYDLAIPGHSLYVSIYNAGDRRRDQLAYLIRKQKEAMAEYGI